MSTIAEPELIQEIAPFDNTGIEARTRGEIDIQISTARRFPRSLVAFKKAALEAATLDEETAASCFYALPRDGKTVEGPSARLAEIVASTWGHLRIEARSVGEDERFTTSRGVAWDLQNNVAVGFEVRRRIAGKNNRKYSDDMIAVTSNAASSIALRNAVFKVVPSPFWRPIYHACREAAVGNAQTLSDRRHKSIVAFGKMGVQPERIFGLLGVKGEEEITLDHLGTLRGLFTAIKDGETTIEEAFPDPNAPKADPAKPGLEALTEKLKAQQQPTHQVGNLTVDTASGEILSVEGQTKAPAVVDENARLDAEIAAQDAKPASERKRQSRLVE